VARLEELVRLDEEHRTAQLKAHGKARAEKSKIKRAKERAERERQQAEQEDPEGFLNKALAEAEEKRKRRREYSRRWYRENKEWMQAESEAH
jgi:hypothetical protein